MVQPSIRPQAMGETNRGNPKKITSPDAPMSMKILEPLFIVHPLMNSRARHASFSRCVFTKIVTTWLGCQYLKPCLAPLVVIGLGEALMPAPPAGPVKDLVHGLRQRQHQAPQHAANRGAAQRDARPRWALKAAWLLRSWTGGGLF